MGEKFNAPDPGATQSTATGEAGQRSGGVRVPTADVDGDGTADVGRPADDPGAGPGAASRNLKQKAWLPANFRSANDAKGDGTADDGNPDVGPPADDPGAGPDAASRNFEKFKNDSPTADAKATDSYMKMENAKSDPAAGPDAASSKEPSAGYDVKKQDRI